MQLPKSVQVKQQMLAEAPSQFKGSNCPRFVYVDLDNVWVSFVRAEHLVARFPGAASTRDLMLNLDGFTRRLAAGAAGSSVIQLMAFYFNTPEAIAARLRQLSHDGVAWDVRKQETMTDTTMQLELLNAKRPCAAHPKTLVLVTGGGNIAPNGMCFREIMDLYLRDGWFVEVHAWLFTMARSYIEFQREYASSVVIRPFDDKAVGDIVRTRRPKVTERTQRKRLVPPDAKNEAKSAVPMAALMQAMEAVRVSPAPSSQPRASAPAKTSPTQTFCPDQYTSVIRQLDGRVGELYVPTGLAMLVQTGVVDASSSIHEAD